MIRRGKIKRMSVSGVPVTLQRTTPKATPQKDSGRCFPPAVQRKMISEAYVSYASYDLLQVLYFNIAIPGTISTITLDVTVTGEIENFLHVFRQFIFKFALRDEVPTDMFDDLNVQCINFLSSQVAAQAGFQELLKDAFDLKRLAEEEVQSHLLDFRYWQPAGISCHQFGQALKAPIQDAGTFFFKQHIGKVIHRLFRFEGFALDPAQTPLPSRDVIITFKFQNRNSITNDENIIPMFSVRSNRTESAAAFPLPP